MLQPHVRGQRPEERHASADEHGHPRNGDLVHDPPAQEPLDGAAAVKVQAPQADLAEALDDFRGAVSHGLDLPAQPGGDRQGTGGEHDDGGRPVRPGLEGQDFLEGLAAHDERIDLAHESLVPVVLALGVAGDVQEVEVAVFSGDEAVDAHPDEDGDLAWGAPGPAGPRCGARRGRFWLRFWLLASARPLPLGPRLPGLWRGARLGPWARPLRAPAYSAPGCRFRGS